MAIITFRKFGVYYQANAASQGALNDYEAELKEKIEALLKNKAMMRRHGVRWVRHEATLREGRAHELKKPSPDERL